MQKALDATATSMQLLSTKRAVRALVSLQKHEGVLPMALRYALLRRITEVGVNVGVRSDVRLLCPQRLRLGNNVSIHSMSYLDATGGIAIGNDVSIAHACTILSTSHSHDDVTSPIKDQPINHRHTVIGDDCWVGARTTILAGVNIGPHSIIGAGAVVTKDVPPYTVCGGVPARVIRSRIGSEGSSERADRL